VLAALGLTTNVAWDSNHKREGALKVSNGEEAHVNNSSSWSDPAQSSHRCPGAWKRDIESASNGKWHKRPIWERIPIYEPSCPLGFPSSSWILGTRRDSKDEQSADEDSWRRCQGPPHLPVVPWTCAAVAPKDCVPWRAEVMLYQRLMKSTSSKAAMPRSWFHELHDPASTADREWLISRLWPVNSPWSQLW